MFINPMWDNESERIGKQRCTPIGYAIHVLSDFIGLVALLCLLGMPFYLVYLGIFRAFSWSSLWLLAVPFAIALSGHFLHSYSWHLATRKGFKYDYETRTARWQDEHGELQTYSPGEEDLRPKR